MGLGTSQAHALLLAPCFLLLTGEQGGASAGAGGVYPARWGAAWKKRQAGPRVHLPRRLSLHTVTTSFLRGQLTARTR